MVHEKVVTLLQKFCDGKAVVVHVFPRPDQATVQQVYEEVLQLCRLDHSYIPCLVYSYIISVLLRPAILDLHERFLCSGGWGLERCFNQWCIRQPWRRIFPTSFLKLLGIRWS